MFILRTIQASGVAINTELGEQYLVIQRFVHPELFRTQFEEYYGKNHVADLDEKSDDTTKGCVGFIHNSESEVLPLLKHDQYYIMTESGKTFEKINIG